MAVLIILVGVPMFFVMSIRGPYLTFERPWKIEDDPVPVVVPIPKVRQCCGTVVGMSHAPGCSWAPPPPSPAQWSNRR